MKNRSVKFLLVCLTGFLFAGCREAETLPEIEMGYDFFPLSQNMRRIYKCDSIVIDDFTGRTDTFHFNLKDSAVAVITETGADTVYKIERYKKEEGSDEWIYQKNYTLVLINNRAEMNDENIRYIKMIYPVSSGKTWDGNAFNNLGEQIYQYSNITIAQLPGGTNTEAITVIQRDETNLIREEYAAETYGRDFGLFKKEVRMIDKDITTQEITAGYIYTQQLTIDN